MAEYLGQFRGACGSQQGAGDETARRLAEAGHTVWVGARTVAMRARKSNDDIARYIMGAAVMNFASEQQRQRMLAVMFDGLRAR